MQRKVIVTGASGHIGFHVADQLLKQGFDVTLLSRRVNMNIQQLLENGAHLFLCDLSTPSSWTGTLNGCEAFFHLASENTTETHDEERVIANTFGLTKTVLDAVIEKKVKTIIYTSSVVVLGRSSDKNILIHENDRTPKPESPYVKGKLLAEEYCDRFIAENKSDIRRL